MRVIIVLLLSFFLSHISNLCGQENFTIDDEFIESTVEQLSSMIVERYVYEDVAKKTSDHLLESLESGKFKEYSSLSDFADDLTSAVQHVNKDKHMKIRPAPNRVAPEATPERFIEDIQARRRQRQLWAGGFAEAKRLEGNIGYLDLRGFTYVREGKTIADKYMSLLQGSDAMIIDLRKNGGGDPAMVQYLCSFFFDEPVHLNSLYYREGEVTTDFFSLKEVGAPKMVDVPLFVLTSSYTFSGAEEFTYNMQTQKRGTIVGETTGGGANPGGMMPINNKLSVFIPTGAAVNPITGTNWEGTGVTPDYLTDSEDALEKAIELAKEASREYVKKIHQKDKNDFSNMLNTINSGNESAILEAFEEIEAKGLIAEHEINMLGYDYMLKYDKPEQAEMIFHANTKLFPDSPNVYDSYGESLLNTKKYSEAVSQYMKAVKTAKSQGDDMLNLYQENLKKAKEKLSD